MAAFDLSSTRLGLGADVEYYSGTARFEKVFGTDTIYYRIGFIIPRRSRVSGRSTTLLHSGDFKTCPAICSGNFWSTAPSSDEWCMSVGCSPCPPSARESIGEVHSKPPTWRIVSTAPKAAVRLDVSGGRGPLGPRPLCGGACRSGGNTAVYLFLGCRSSRLIEHSTGRLHPCTGSQVAESKPGTRRA